MKMTFRWYGHDDPVTLDDIRQIPGMHGIVSAIYDIPVGEVWPLERILELKATIESKGLELSVIESVPVHEAIKLGLPTRDNYIENYKTTLIHLGQANIKTVCYNFMPVFDWTRTQLHYPNEDGSTALAYIKKDLKNMDPTQGDLTLPGWDTSYTKESLKSLLDQYHQMTKEDLWNNLNYFIQAILPVAERADVKMAIHPDDPPRDIFGIPRIISTEADLTRLTQLYDSQYNGITFCTGSLGARPDNHLEEIAAKFASLNRINFAHLRNILRLEDESFIETAHLSSYGSLDFVGIIQALYDHGFTGAFRPDHGRMIWKETGRPGYGLYDRALGATYLNGIYETLCKTQPKNKEK